MGGTVSLPIGVHIDSRSVRRRSLTEEAGDPDEAEQAVESPPGSRQSVTL